jgi:hypothetical protein
MIVLQWRQQEIVFRQDAHSQQQGKNAINSRIGKIIPYCDKTFGVLAASVPDILLASAGGGQL